MQEIIDKIRQKIDHLNAKIKKEVDRPCIFCESMPAYSDEFDCYYCPKCMHWLENICPDRNCCFCKRKPKYPGELKT